jgi:hypothetical protein
MLQSNRWLINHTLFLALIKDPFLAVFPQVSAKYTEAGRTFIKPAAVVK